MLSGQAKREWFVVAAALVLGAALLLLSRGRPLSDTKRISVNLTLVTADRQDVACALDGQILGYGCRYGKNHRPASPPPPKERLLGPYGTVDGRFLLVPALFEQPELRARYEREPPASKPKARLERFVATCQVELLTRVPELEVRFGRSKWTPMTDLWLAKPLTCTVKN